MADYLYADDGKIHTRYSELANCTAGGVSRVIQVRQGERSGFSNERTDFGSQRHDNWEKETKKTGLIPACYGHAWPVSHAEKEFATELLPGVIVHSRPDAVCEAIETIVDYKTLCAKNYREGIQKALKKYRNSKQLTFYAYQLGLHGIRIKKGVYLIEIWNDDCTEILGYFDVIVPLAMKDVASVLPWVKDRVAMLVGAIELAEVKT